MSADELIAAVDDYARTRVASAATHPETASAEDLLRLVSSRRGQVRDLVRLAEACRRARIDLLPVTARKACHNTGIVIDPGPDRVLGVGILGHPSILAMPTGRVIVTRTDVLAVPGISEHPWPTAEPPARDVELACRGLLANIDDLEGRFRDYVIRTING